MEFVQPLEEIHSSPGDTATFECELNKDNVTVVWLRNGKEIKPSKHFEIKKEGAKHRMIVKSVQFDDDAEYTVKVKNEESTSHLTVQGT